jgi:cytohesin
LGARVCKNKTLLIEVGADINKADDDGVTQLYIAAELGQEAIVRALIEEGADVNKAINDGTTPLYIADREGHETIVQILKNAGAV